VVKEILAMVLAPSDSNHLSPIGWLRRNRPRPGDPRCQLAGNRGI